MYYSSVQEITNVWLYLKSFGWHTKNLLLAKTKDLKFC